MSARSVGLVALGLLLGAACSSKSNQPGGPSGTGGSSGSAGSGTGGSAGSAAGGSAGSSGGSGGATGGSGGSAGSAAGGSAGSGAAAGASGSGGSAGTDGGAGSGGTGGSAGASSQCGNGVLEFGEQCDGTDLGGKTCTGLGFDSGTLACKNCSLDVSSCVGKEDCFDGVDHDGDHAIDCADSDCTAVCADPCGTAITLADPADVTGNTTGHATVAAPSCARSGSQAPAIAYKFTATQTGMLDVLLASSQALVASVRTTCSDAGSESYCGETSQTSAPINQGDTVYIVVAGRNTTDAGKFELAVRSRVPACGDGVLDSGEECDDGGKVDGDGCSATCTVESDETDPNDDSTNASPYADPFHGQITPAGDVDYVKVDVTTAGASLTADIYDYGDGACYKNLLDSYIEILGTDGTTVLASDDDGGSGLCSHAVASNLAAGTYYVMVKASDSGFTPTFPYVLHVSVN
jgi:cysteine-rich repeat protein